ncbi:PQQ-binding-like beta-propeller repeat protein, partial [Planctomycetota bacterium]
MQKHIRGFAVLCTMLFVSVSHAEDWPTYMKDNTRVGRTSDTLATGLSEHWVRTSATPPQWAWPGPGEKVIEGLKLRHRARFDDVFHVAIVGERVFYGSSVDNAVYCVAADSGEVLWRFVTSGPIRLAPTVADSRVYVGSDDGNAYCLDAASGERIWQFHPGPQDDRILARGRMSSRWPVRTGVLIDDGIAYFGAGVFPHETVYLCAVNADTGAVIWKNDTISQRDAGRNDLTPQGYLLATAERIFVPSARTLPAAFDRATGKMLHKQTSGGKQIGGS